MATNIDLTNVPPIHPGKMMKDVLLHNHNLDITTVAHKVGIPEATLENFANGQGKITEEMRDQLRDLFGVAANQLYEMQKTYDYFSAHGHRPPQKLTP